ncbi:hypothetical protein ACFSE0_12585 [Ochrobactrum teleogrylli]|uniref:Uncharacterized protein n=1 Tax=Ochrobactrum teleogrylli TaxID=2479765 RepID=A0ABY2Y3I4_9HYPH|nr:hypothetical protein [[Ochrobactrum] teleogrylli]TNV15859.1 hypothetical protein FIC94_11265 [[Ochrobactrum] teleogrylli]
MRKVDIGDNIYVVNGRITERSGGEGDSQIGTVYSHILIDDTAFSNVIIPHSLKNHLEGQKEFYLTKFRSAWILTAVNDGKDGRISDFTQVPLNPIAIFVFFAGIVASYFSIQAASHPAGGIFYVIALVVFVGFTFVAFNASNLFLLSRYVDKNISLLKKAAV